MNTCVSRIIPVNNLVSRIICCNRTIGLTSVRWKRVEPKRKPIWAPMAPSKLFVIKEPVVYPKDEMEQMNHLYFHYDSEMLSVREYVRDHIYLPAKTSGGLSEDQIRYEEEEHQKLLIENQLENQRVAEMRSERLASDRVKEELDMLDEETERKNQEESLRKEAERQVILEINRSKTFITRENLEKSIQESMLHPVHYDFAIDKDGNIVTDGRLHDYAFKPSAIPETSSHLEVGMKQLSEDKAIKMKAKRLFFEVKV